MVILLLAACATDGEDTAPLANGWDRGDNPHALDDVLRLNHIQVKGTHNSYHLAPDNPLDDSHRYSHLPLAEQLEQQSVRQFELDVHLGEDGQWMVHHIPVIDAETTCSTFVDCLQQIRAWSDANGWHLPLTVWIEPKDDVDGLAPGLQPIEDIRRLDDAIAEVWPPARLFTPDDLRGAHATLPEALAADGWPTLGPLRGRVLFALLDSGAHRDTYTTGAENLAGRTLFVDCDTPDQPFCALVKDGSPAQIETWATDGYLITDNGSGAADSAADAEAADNANLAAGVHHLATDIPGAVDGRSYALELTPRCNPVTAPPDCDDTELERL